MKATRLAVMLMLGPGIAATAFAQTPEVLYYGFSQSGQGFCGVGGKRIETILLEGECPEPARIDGLIILGVTKGSAAIGLWADPQYEGYDFDAYHLPKPSTERIEKDQATHVVLNVSGGQRELVEWVNDIEQAVATMKALHPNALKFYLQPVGTGPLDQAGEPVQCERGGTVVRAVRNHPRIAAAINEVAEQDAMVHVGLVARLSDCDFFEDSIGHYGSNGGAAEVRGQIEDFYAVLLTEPPDTVPPMPPTDLDTLE